MEIRKVCVRPRIVDHSSASRREMLAGVAELPDTCRVRKILVIDDDREMVDLLGQSLAEEGFDLSTAQSGSCLCAT